MFCSFRLGLQLISEPTGLPVLFFLTLGDAVWCLRSWYVLDLGNKVWILFIFSLRMKTPGLWRVVGKQSYIRYKPVCPSLCAILHFRRFQGLALFAAVALGALGAMLVFSWPATLCPQSPSTSDSSCLCLSCRGWTHDKMMRLITHINGSAPFAVRVYMNGLQWLIYNRTLNPVLCKGARESESLQSNLRHEHARKSPHCCEGLSLFWLSNFNQGSAKAIVGPCVFGQIRTFCII